MNNTKKKIIVIALLVIIIFIGLSYAWLGNTSVGSNNSTLRAGQLILKLDESASNGILINPAYPLTNSEGLNTTPKYKFTLKNEGNISSEYIIYLDDITTADKKMNHNIIKYNLKKIEYNADDSVKLNNPDRLDLLSNSKVDSLIVLDSGVIDSGEYIDYTFQLWMDYDAGNEYQGTSFKGQLRIEGSQIK